ncbi:MAG: hypothetical protein QW561_01695 [Candidatus Aenigmatarchaeota archaeon]
MTFGDLKIRIQKFVPELTIADVGTFINNRYQQLLKNWQWSFLKAYANLTCIAPYTAGTVNVTNGSTTVTGSGTNWSTAMVGRHFRLSNAVPFYKIASVTSATSLTLSSAYGGDTAVGQGYEIFQHIYSLAPDVREISKIVYDEALLEKSVEWIERNDPDRSVSGKPMFWADRGLDANNVRQIELYPYPDTNYVIRYSYWKKIEDLSSDTDIILLRDDLLQEATLLDCYRVAVNKNPNYSALLSVTAAQFVNLWTESVAEDMRKASFERETRDYNEDRIYTDDFLKDHWPGPIY